MSSALLGLQSFRPRVTTAADVSGSVCITGDPKNIIYGAHLRYATGDHFRLKGEHTRRAKGSKVVKGNATRLAHYRRSQPDASSVGGCGTSTYSLYRR